MLSRAVSRSSIQASRPAVRVNARNAAVLARAVHTAGRQGGRWQKYAVVMGAVTLGTAVYLASGSNDENRIRAASAQAEQTEGSLNFRNPEFAFKTKSDFEIMRALFVLKLCGLPWLVSSSESLLKLGERLHLKVPIYAFIRQTFFKQFCAGEDADAVRPVMAKFGSNGVGSVLDLSMEVDEDREITPEHCDYVASKIIECIETASAEPGAFTAVKATALAKPEVLLRTSALLSYLKTVYGALDTEQTGRVTLAQFSAGMQRMGYRLSEHETQLLFSQLDANKDGCIDPIDFAQAMPVTGPVVTALFQTKNRGRVRVDSDAIWIGHRLQGDDMQAPVSLPYEPPSWTEEDIRELHLLLQRMERVCAAAQRLGVRIMVDAEQSYFQPAIDLVAVAMMARFNMASAQPLVYNTHQMYLKRAVPKLQAEMLRAQREGWAFGAKLVRGAYMVSERRRAHELGIEDPICRSKEETDGSYDQGVALVLGAVAQGKPVALMVASHNEHSINKTVQQMRDLAIPTATQAVYFGQLMGMCDHISLTLGAKGFNIAKYVPYGPIGETIPYLLRRAQENSSILGQTLTERTMLWMELKRRAFNTLPALAASPAQVASPLARNIACNGRMNVDLTCTDTVLDLAFAYPYHRPSQSFLYANGHVAIYCDSPSTDAALDPSTRVQPVDTSDPTYPKQNSPQALAEWLQHVGGVAASHVVPMGERVPVLAVGSNAGPPQIGRKFLGHLPPEECVVPVVRCDLLDHDIVYAPIISYYGCLPATLLHRPGTTVSTYITYLSPAQLHRMHRTEGSYLFYALPQAQHTLPDMQPGSPQTLHAYVWPDGVLHDGSGQPTALRAINASQRSCKALGERDAQELAARLLGVLGPEGVEQFALENVRDSSLRKQRIAALCEHHSKPLGVEVGAVLVLDCNDINLYR